MDTDIIEIEPEKLRRMKQLHVNIVLLDLRTTSEYQKSHIDGALNVEASKLIDQLPKLIPQKDMPIVVYDHDGVQSAQRVIQAQQEGYLNIVNLLGGYQAWQVLARD